MDVPESDPDVLDSSFPTLWECLNSEAQSPRSDS